MILLSAPSDAMFGLVDTALAAENMLLCATGLGLGSCFIVTPAMMMGIPGNSDLAVEVGVPEGYKAHCAVLVGYAAPENKFSPKAEERQPKGTVNYCE
jgi:hypothetical protein